jgi:protein-S-isoprenylcysteine O-methyltransferase Ste14
VNTPLHPIALASDTLGARAEAAVYGQRNVLACVPVVLAWLAMGRPLSGAGLAIGAALVAAGSALRAWATLYNRYAQGCERKSLATGGPYSWLRNPLYVANSLVLLGGFAASGLWAWLPAAGLWFALVYTLTIRHEERRLLEKYGSAYAAYCTNVPRWLPRRRGDWPQVSWRRFLPALAVQSRSLLILAPFLLRSAL